MKVHELLDTPEKWCKGDFARTSDGKAIAPTNLNASCFCLLGSVYHCYSSSSAVNEIYLAIAQRIKADGWEGNVSTWNDAHTFEEVRKLALDLDI